MFALDPAAQTATPLEIVRSAYREPTAVLVSAGVPAVERDGFDQHAWPDDRYGLVPHTLGDLGDPDLAPLMLAWGMAKAAVLVRAPSGQREYPYGHNALERVDEMDAAVRHDWSTR